MLLTIKEAADYAGVAPTSIWRKIETGKIAKHTHQGIKFVSSGAVEAVFDNCSGPIPQFPYKRGLYLTIEEAAQELGYSLNYTRQLIKQGDIQAIDKGTRKLIHKHWLEKFEPKSMGRPEYGDPGLNPKPKPRPAIYCINEDCRRRVYSPREDGLCSVCRKKAGGYVQRSKRPHNHKLTQQQELAILEARERGESAHALGEVYGVSFNTIYNAANRAKRRRDAPK